MEQTRERGEPRLRPTPDQANQRPHRFPLAFSPLASDWWSRTKSVDDCKEDPSDERQSLPYSMERARGREAAALGERGATSPLPSLTFRDSGTSPARPPWTWPLRTWRRKTPEEREPRDTVEGRRGHLEGTSASSDGLEHGWRDPPRPHASPTQREAPPSLRTSHAGHSCTHCSGTGCGRQGRERLYEQRRPRVTSDANGQIASWVPLSTWVSPVCAYQDHLSPQRRQPKLVDAGRKHEAPGATEVATRSRPSQGSKGSETFRNGGIPGQASARTRGRKRRGGGGAAPEPGWRPIVVGWTGPRPGRPGRGVRTKRPLPAVSEAVCQCARPPPLAARLDFARGFSLAAFLCPCPSSTSTQDASPRLAPSVPEHLILVAVHPLTLSTALVCPLPARHPARSLVSSSKILPAAPLPAARPLPCSSLPSSARPSVVLFDLSTGLAPLGTTRRRTKFPGVRTRALVSTPSSRCVCGRLVGRRKEEPGRSSGQLRELRARSPRVLGSAAEDPSLLSLPLSSFPLCSDRQTGFTDIRSSCYPSSQLAGEYGLRNKREIWRIQLTLSKIRRAARELLKLDAKDPKRLFEVSVRLLYSCTL